jgi:hypothetical protein
MPLTIYLVTTIKIQKILKFEQNEQLIKWECKYMTI